MKNIKIAHISDLHFSSVSWSPKQFFSKQWVGNIHHILSRRFEHDTTRLEAIPSFFKEMGITHVFITGDFSTTSQIVEFEQAQAFVKKLKNQGLIVLSIPGNHDQYTKKAYHEQLFYDYFSNTDQNSGERILEFSLKNHAVAAEKIDKEWWVVTVDTALSTQLFSSHGLFSESIEKNLNQLLLALPKNHNVILMNHYPFFQQESYRKSLRRGPHLQAILRRHPQIKFYLHGHTHRQSLADLREDGLPIILDSGSLTSTSDASFNVIDLSEQSISVFQLNQGWNCTRKVSLKW